MFLSGSELYPYRHGLFFAFFHALNWQVVIGTPTVLFMQELHATPVQVGLVFAWTFLLMPAQIVATAHLPRLGFKQLTLFGWNTRAWFLLVPIALAIAAPTAPEAWMAQVMVVAMFGYCLFRAIGSAALMPWLHHFVPPHVRGRYWATEQILAALAGLGILLVCALLFVFLPVFDAFLIQYSIAALGALAAYRMLKHLPDFERPRLISFEKILLETPRLMFQPGIFRTYLWLSVALFVAITPLPAFAAYYLKATGRAASAEIMMLTVATYLGVISVNLLMRSRLDRIGAKPFFRLSYICYAVVATGWLALLQIDAGWNYVLPGLFFVQGCGAGCWTSSNLNYLAQMIPESDRALPVSLHGATITFLGGFSPVIWGFFLEAPAIPNGISLPVLTAFFLMVGIVALALNLSLRLLPDAVGPAEPLVRGAWILRPIRGLSSIINLIDSSWSSGIGFRPAPRRPSVSPGPDDKRAP